MPLAVTWGTGEVLLDMLWFFLFIIEIWLMISIFIDLFRRHDLAGWVKALWVVAIILVPFVGILLYLIIYGGEMRVHAQQAQRDAARDLGWGAPPWSPSDELTRLADLRDRGVISEEEFQKL